MPIRFCASGKPGTAGKAISEDMSVDSKLCIWYYEKAIE